MKAVLILLVLLFFGAVGYAIYETWHIFGLLTMVLLGIALVFLFNSLLALLDPQNLAFTFAWAVVAGFVLGLINIWLLVRRIGTPLAKELVYSGRFVGAEEAVKLGIANHMTEDGSALDKALELARQFSGDESVSFINGVLDAVRKDIPAQA